MFLGQTSSQGCAHEVKHKSQEPLRDPSTKRSPKRKEEGLWQDWDVQNVRAVPVLGGMFNAFAAAAPLEQSTACCDGAGGKKFKNPTNQKTRLFLLDLFNPPRVAPGLPKGGCDAVRGGTGQQSETCPSLEHR